ncbi:MAG: redoxin domain-containing protein, partial [Burkholderiales bacterium]
MNTESTTQAARGSSLRYGLPLAAFLVLAVFLGIGLNLNPREVPSPLVGKPAPHFELPQLHRTDLRFSETDMRGKVWMLNVWASWCAACRDEHPVLVELGPACKDGGDKGYPEGAPHVAKEVEDGRCIVHLLLGYIG